MQIGVLVCGEYMSARQDGNTVTVIVTPHTLYDGTSKLHIEDVTYWNGYNFVSFPAGTELVVDTSALD